MALIKYPNDGANTFATVAEATLIIEKYFIEKAIEWNELGILKQTSLMQQTYVYMMTCPNLNIPTDYDNHSDTFKTAQSFLALTWMDKDLFSIDMNGKSIKREKVGDLEVEYDTALKVDADQEHPYFYRLLSPYGCTSSTGFSQSSTEKA